MCAGSKVATPVTPDHLNSRGHRQCVLHGCVGSDWDWMVQIDHWRRDRAAFLHALGLSKGRSIFFSVIRLHRGCARGNG